MSLHANRSGRFSSIVTLALSLCLAGCARWYNEPMAAIEPTSNLPTAKPGPDTVDIETVLIRFSSDQLFQLEETWKSVDETILDFNRRLRLDKNGLRVGLIRGELPATIRQQLQTASEQQKSDISESAGLTSDAESRSRRLRCQAGRRKEVVIRRDVGRTLSIVTTIDGQLSGQSFDNRPTAILTMTPFPQADGKAVLDFVPEVQYGDAQSKYLATEFGMRQEQRRPSKIWKDLKIQAQLEQGNVLVIAATQPPKLLGGSFFVTDTVHGSEEHLVLLVRLVATQMDDLFGPPQGSVVRSMAD